MSLVVHGVLLPFVVVGYDVAVSNGFWKGLLVEQLIADNAEAIEVDNKKSDYARLTDKSSSSDRNFRKDVKKNIKI